MALNKCNVSPRAISLNNCCMPSRKQNGGFDLARGEARGGLVTKSRRSFSDFTNHEEDNFIFTIFLNTPDNKTTAC